MLRSANSSAIARGIGSKFTFREADIAKQPLRGTYDVVIANQCLHHFVALEAIFDKIYASLIRGGLFLTSDVIGRNGHQLWPEALVEVESIWNRLADKYKYDKTQGKVSRRFINYNHANVGFEGIRAQDVLPLLVERFEFEVFAPYACIIMPFVERRFGWNFDRENETDRKFIDEVTARDEVLLASGKVKPTQLLARMSNVPPSSLITTAKVSIRDCVRTPG